MRLGVLPWNEHLPDAQQGKTCQHHCRRAGCGFGATSVGFGTISDSSLLCVALAMTLAMEAVTAELLCQVPSSQWMFPSSDPCWQQEQLPALTLWSCVSEVGMSPSWWICSG